MDAGKNPFTPLNIRNGFISGVISNSEIAIEETIDLLFQKLVLVQKGSVWLR